MTHAPWMTDANVSKARQLWDDGMSTAHIAQKIGHGCTKNAIVGLAHRRNWPPRASIFTGVIKERVHGPRDKRVRPKTIIAISLPPRRRNALPKNGAISIPLRAVYQLAAQLDLPRTQRGDIHALNNAVKRMQPDHPGFVLADYQPTRLTWAV